jgi:uncharacterized protein YndB with AHSA1/START domain
MSVISMEKDVEGLTLTLVAEFDAPIERVWELWADPRLLERWWGPPTYPATVEDHDLRPGGRIRYHMTGREGDRHHAWMEVVSVDRPRALRVREGFADESGVPLDGMPVGTMDVTFAEAGGRTRMELRYAFDSREDMERLVEMGMPEGIRQAVGQIDALLAEPVSS